MIEGIRCSPYIRYFQSERDRDYLDCQDCMRTMPAQIRRSYHCGYERRSDWTGDVPRYPRAHDVKGRAEASQCPGYLIGLPGVLEAQRCHLWWKHGQLELRLEGYAPTAPLMQAIEECDASYRALESALMQDARDK